MKKRLTILALLTALLLPCLPARAGWNPLDVATDGKGIVVYASSSGGKQAGILYNGYNDSLSLEDTNGLYSCGLTMDYTVWLDQDKAEKNQPRGDEIDWYGDAWIDQMPSDMFLAEVTQPDAPLYTTPGHKTLAARHAAGTLIMVCGEFGDDYFVRFDGNGFRGGFMPKSALKKIGTLTYRQANYISEKWGLTDAREATVYTDGGPIAIGASATGYSAFDPIVLENGKQVTVFREINGWAQLSGGSFIESRFLDPDGDHSVAYATVNTSGPLNRLNVRGYPSTDAWVQVKLCAGAQVQVASHTDDWAAVLIVGPEGGEEESGSVQMKYLVFGDDTQIKNGCVRVRLTEDRYEDQYRYDKKQLLPAGTELTVLGVNDGYDIERDNCDCFLCLTEDGRTVMIFNDSGVLEPVGEGLGVTAKAASNVRMRVSPSKDAEVIRTLDKGTKVEVLLRGEGWTLVKYKDQTGYVMSRYLSFP